MKKSQFKPYFPFLIILITFHSCDSGTSQKQNTVVKDTVEMAEEKDVFTAPEAPIERKFELSEMQGKWWLLTAKDKQLIRYNHWDAQDETIVIETDKNGIGWLEISTSQETDAGPITSFNASIIEGEGISKVTGSFTFKGGLDDTTKQIKFTWNQYQYFAIFENLNYPKDYYVHDHSKDFFPYEETFREAD